VITCEKNAVVSISGRLQDVPERVVIVCSGEIPGKIIEYS